MVGIWQKHVSRRDLIKAAGVAGATAALASPLAACAPQAAPAKDEKEPFNLNFAVWTYDMEKIKQNVSTFEGLSGKGGVPKTTITVADYGWAQYQSAITSRFTAGVATDVLYGSDHWMAQWARAGWIVPLEDQKPAVKEYAKEFPPFVVEGLTFNGKLYALPYYADIMAFVYNKKMLAAAGIAKPPATWGEVQEQSLALKSKSGVETPLVLPFTNDPFFDEIVFSMIYADGGNLFDDKGNAQFGTGSGAPENTVQWIADAINKHQIMPKKVLEMAPLDVQQTFKDGKAAFCIVPSYMLREFANAKASKVVGDYDMALMPGSTHASTGFARTYHLTKSAVARGPKVVDACWGLIEYLGGKFDVEGTKAYHVTKRWSVENGLGFAPNSLWDDPDIKKAFGEMVPSTDILKEQRNKAKAKQGFQMPWYAEWTNTFRTEVQNALLVKKTPPEAMKSAVDAWNKLKKSFGQ